MAFLPDDLIISNIFIRLPAKQIAQMRSLSKHWNAFLSHPDFIKSHLDCSIFKGKFSFKGVEPFTAHPCRSPDIQLKDFIKSIVANLPINEINGVYKVVGSINGMICFYTLYSKDADVYIWNPSISALLSVPPYTMPSSSHRYHLCLRFGYDPKTDDYQVVKLNTIDNSRKWGTVEVYTMRKGCWKSIISSPPQHTILIDPDIVCSDGHNGHLHWSVYTDHESYIVAFDLSLETFNVLSLPDFKQKQGSVLCFMSGKLCVMSRELKEGEWEVWVMDEYGVCESWVKKHVFSQRHGIGYPFGFTLNNELLFEHNDDKFLASYNLGTSTVKSFKVSLYPINHPYICNKFVQYVDSLVWVTPAKHDINVS